MDRQTRTSLSNEAYDKLMQYLIDGRLKVGMKVSQQQLSRELGIGTTPIREAIQRLCEDGLLYQKPQSGTYVAAPDRKSLIEVYEVRLALERFAAFLAADRITADEINILKQAVARTQAVGEKLKASKANVLTEKLTREFLSADITFHRTVLEAAGNTLLLKSVTAGQIRNRVFGLASHKRDYAHISRVVKIHKAVVSALARHDAQAAAESMETHIRQSMEEAIKAYDETIATMNPVYNAICKTAVALQNIINGEKDE